MLGTTDRLTRGAAMLPPVSVDASVTAASSRRNRAQAKKALRWERWALPVIISVGALNFLWQLGSSSYYVDETLSIEHSLPSLGSVLTVVRMTETTPWTYFLFLHEWLYRTGSQAEWVTRLPSAVAGILLVGAAYWTARAFLDRRAALLASAFCALSPLVLEYAQQVRVYIFAMLAATIAVGAAARAPDAPSGRGRLLAAGAVMAVLSLWLHYTAALVILPLCVWFWTRESIPRRTRALFIGVCLLAELAALPLLIDQYHYAPNGGLVGIANLTWGNVVRVIETPFDSRAAGGVGIVRLLGAAVVLGSVLTVALRRRGTLRDGRLLAALALFAPLALVVIAAAGKDVLITRYTAVATPFMLMAVAGAVAMLPRARAILLVALTLVLAGIGLTDSHRSTGFYAPARDAIRYIEANPQPRESVVTPGLPGDDVPLDYYAERLMSPLPTFIAGTDTAPLAAAIGQRRPLWLITDIANSEFSNAGLLRSAALLLRPRGYRPLSVRTFTTVRTFAVFLTAPLSAAHAARR